MNVSYSFDGRVLLLTTPGRPGWTETRDTLDAALADPRLEPGRTTLIVDARLADVAPPVDSVRRIARYLADLASRLDGIGIVTADPLRYGLSRMVASFAETDGATILVFSSMEAARRWSARRQARERSGR